MTTTIPATCACGHLHETVMLDGFTSVFHRCRVKGCDCDAFTSSDDVVRLRELEAMAFDTLQRRAAERYYSAPTRAAGGEDIDFSRNALEAIVGRGEEFGLITLGTARDLLARITPPPARAEPGEAKPSVCGRRIIRGGYMRGFCGLPFGHDSANNPNASPCRPVQPTPVSGGHDLGGA